jgi:antitoxin CptB
MIYSNECGELSRLRCQCRRGLKELDVMLATYLERYYAKAGEKEKQQFKVLLLLEDPVLALLLLSEEKGDSDEQDRLLQKLRMVACQRFEL